MTSVGSSGMQNIENIFIQWRLSPNMDKSVNISTVSPVYSSEMKSLCGTRKRDYAGQTV